MEKILLLSGRVLAGVKQTNKTPVLSMDFKLLLHLIIVSA